MNALTIGEYINLFTVLKDQYGDIPIGWTQIDGSLRYFQNLDELKTVIVDLPIKLTGNPEIEEFREVSNILETESKKYGVENSLNDHLSHALRHIYAYLAGDRSDNHLGNAACHLLSAMWCKNND